MDNELHGRHYAIVVAGEGAAPIGGSELSKGAGEIGRQDVVLGHLQRGRSPTTFDRLVSLRFGAAAVRMVETGQKACPLRT